jgi:hypothetical protein
MNGSAETVAENLILIGMTLFVSASPVLLSLVIVPPLRGSDEIEITRVTGPRD